MTPNPNYVDALWIDYREKVLDPLAGHVQLVETKRAFFAGVVSMWTAVMTDLLDDGTEPTLEDYRRLAHIQEELEAYGRSGGRL